MIGDAYVGYAGGLPDNNDAVPGTLFCGRGILIGRGVSVGTASIGMEGNVIWGLGWPRGPDHAVHAAYINTYYMNRNRFSAIAKSAISSVEKAESIEDIKAALLQMLKTQADDINDQSYPEGITG